MNYAIGLSGLRTAQRALEIAGTNIANVATPGYHRQDVLLEALETDRLGLVPVGGVQVRSIRRSLDSLLEREIRGQQPAVGQLSQELSTLRALEAAFGTLDAGGLDGALNDFFAALRELAADPHSQALREQAVWAADSLAANFRHLGATVRDLKDQVLVETEGLLGQVNNLAQEIGDLDRDIEAISLRGGNANLLMDRRDQAINELGELIEVQVNERRDGSNGVDVIVLGTPLVISGNAAGLEAGVMHDGKLGLSAAGANYYTSDVHGGQIGGLIALYNDLLVEAQDDLNALADGIITGTNRQHVRGVGTAGSFDQLTGTRIADADALLADWNAPVTAGILRLRVVAPDGTVARYAVAVDPTTDTLNTIAAALDALDPAHLSASVVDSRLRLEGKAGYQFDFLPPATLALGPPWTGTSAPTPSGSYTGAANETYTFTVTAGGQVGVDAGVTVEVHDAVGGLVATLDVGAAYTPGTALAVENGLEVAFSAGAVVTDEQFVIDAVADPVAPAVRLRPAWNGTAAPSLSGLYEGAVNDEFTFIVVGAGQVGVEPDLAVEVRNGAGELVTTLEVGQGYAAGDPLSIYEGLQVAFDVGTLAAGESFRVEAIADSDTSGLLAAAGSNTLFSGTLAENMALREDVAADPRRLVTARGEAMADNAAVRAMAALGEQQLEALGGAAPTDFYRVMVTGVGQKIAFRDTRLRSLRDALQQLENQRDRLSGVDLNNEAADMLVFERMFQAMAKFLNTQHEAMNTLMDLL